jgi:HEAT repeat protein
LVRCRAAEALEKIGPKAKDTAPHLAEVLGQHPEDKEFRLAATRALVRIGPEAGALPGLLQALGDEAGDVSQVAEQALSKKIDSFSKADIPELRQALKTKKPKVCVLVCKALSPLQGDAKAAVPEIRELLGSKDINLRLEAISVLGNIGTGALAAAPDLCQALKDQNGQVRLRAAVTLVQVDPKIEAEGKEGIRVLVKTLKPETKKDAEDPNAQAQRQVAQEALIKVGKPAIDHLIRAVEVDFLGAYVTEEDYCRASARQAVFEIFGKMGSRAYSGDLHRRLAGYMKQEAYPPAQKALYEAFAKIQVKD